jgi:hypothetical protein
MDNLKDFDFLYKIKIYSILYTFFGSVDSLGVVNGCLKMGVKY